MHSTNLSPLQQAQLQWEIRQVMRHLVEVMLAVEGKYQWAKRVEGARREQGLPLPSVTFHSSGEEMSVLMRLVGKEVDKELMRLMVSFI